MPRLQNKIALVTGGSRGIGLAIGRALAAEGAHVVLAARSPNDLHAATEEIRKQGHSASAFRTDIAEEGQVQALVRGTLERYGTVDILVNNAGVGVFKPVTELTPADFDTMWNLNVRGAYLVTRAVLPAMIKAKSGAVVNIASLAGKNAIKGGAGYCATKWALRGFASSLMLEVREHNIRVITIFPGSVDTGFSPRGKKGPNITQPEDVAGAVVFAVTAPERSMFSEIDLRPTNPA
jgi:3-oxoacyl-[acyl-carrier protein] reductase